jgi:hypothetical protein
MQDSACRADSPTLCWRQAGGRAGGERPEAEERREAEALMAALAALEALGRALGRPPPALAAELQADLAKLVTKHVFIQARPRRRRAAGRAPRAARRAPPLAPAAAAVWLLGCCCECAQVTQHR